MGVLLALVSLLAVDVIRMRSPWLETDAGPDGWWAASAPLASTLTYFEAMDQFSMRPDRYEDYRAIALALAMHDAGDGPVPLIYAPADIGELSVRGPEGALVVPTAEYLDLVSGGRLRSAEYDAVLPEEEIASFFAESRVVSYPWDVYRVEPSGDEEAYVVHRDSSRTSLFLVPLSLSPAEEGL
jgi:hypothetical protein